MNIKLITVLALTWSPLFAAPKYDIVVGGYDDELFRTVVRFTDPSIKEHVMNWGGEPNFPWPPLFFESPNGDWILHIQKVGSGQNEAWLFRVDEVGRVFRFEKSLTDMAWAFSDGVSDLKFSQLYHTGVSDPRWTTRQTLAFTLRGSDVNKSRSGVILELEYDLVKNTISRR